MVMVDDCHAAGFIGASGRGTPEHCGVADRVDIITGTLGKALGGASGGFTSGRQRDRRVAAPALAALSLLQHARAGRSRRRRSKALRAGRERRRAARSGSTRNAAPLPRAGWSAPASRWPGEHPIIPVMLGDARWRRRWPTGCSSEGIYVIGFCFPVVPQGQARIRTQMSAAHTPERRRRRDRGVRRGRARARE